MGLRDRAHQDLRVPVRPGVHCCQTIADCWCESFRAEEAVLLSRYDPNASCSPTIGQAPTREPCALRQAVEEHIGGVTPGIGVHASEVVGIGFVSDVRSVQRNI